MWGGLYAAQKHSANIESHLLALHLESRSPQGIESEKWYPVFIVDDLCCCRIILARVQASCCTSGVGVRRRIAKALVIVIIVVVLLLVALRTFQ